MKQIGTLKLDCDAIKKIVKIVNERNIRDYKYNLDEYVDLDNSFDYDDEIENWNVLEKGDYVFIYLTAHGISAYDNTFGYGHTLNYDIEVTRMEIIKNDSEDDDYYLVDDESLKQICGRLRGFTYDY